MTQAKVYITNILKLIFASLLIYWLITSGKLNLTSLEQLLNPSVFFISFILIGLNLLICSERWRKLLISQDLHTTWQEALRFTLVGTFFNYVIPGGVGGDVVKGYYIIRRHPEQKARSALTVAMDRFVGLYAMMFLALLVMIWDWNQVTNNEKLRLIFIFLFMLFLGLSLIWTFVFSNRISTHKWIFKIIEKLPQSESFLKLHSTITHYAKTKKIIFTTFFFSLVAQSLAVLFFIFIGSSLGFEQVSIHTYFFVVPIGIMITAVPISPAGVGVGQAAFYFLFDLINPSLGQLGSTGITAMQIFYFIYGLIGAVFYVLDKPRKAITT